jgi:hypothetical protein
MKRELMGLVGTSCLKLRNRGSGVRIPPSAPKHPLESEGYHRFGSHIQDRWSLIQHAPESEFEEAPQTEAKAS